MRGKQLVIFGCGYVGTALAESAHAAGAEVTALTRNAARAATLRGLGLARVVEADLLGADWPRQIPAGVEQAVVCLSAGRDDPDAYRRAYVEGMEAVVQWAKRNGRPVETLLYTGSTGVYPQSGGAVVDETAATEDGGARVEILREAENRLRAAGPAVDRWFILRLAGIYGPGRHALLDQLRAGVTLLPGDGAHRLNLAHRDDIVSAILACLTAPPEVRNEIYNVADGSPATKAEVVHGLCARLGRAEPVFAGPSAAGARGASDRIISSLKLQRSLGWRPRYPTWSEGYAAL